MFDDDFESMLKAVCEAADTKVPKLPRPKRPRPSKTELTKTKPKTERRESKYYGDQEYVPPQEQKGTYDRSKFIFSNFKTSIVQEKLTPLQLDRIRRRINEAKAQHGNIQAEKQDFNFMDEIYPAEAAEALLLSGTRHWTGANLDDALEGILYTWLKEKNPENITEYITALSKAICYCDCMEGVFLRLNLNTIADATPDSIRINTKFGTVTQTSMPRKGVFTGELRQKMKFFLTSQDKFTGNINTIYNGLARINRIYGLEQTLLSWMGYVVTRAMVENSKDTLGNGGQLLIEDQSIAADIR